MTILIATPSRQLARLIGLALGCFAILAGCTELAASPSRRPLLERTSAALFPSADPGYLPLVGTPALRIGAARQKASAICAPTVALYAPPAPASQLRDQPPAATEIAANSDATAPAPAATADRKPPPIRPEDFLPYFQLDQGANPEADGSLRFTPAQPALPTSRAEYRQQ